MALKIKDNANNVVKVPSMKEVNDRITARIQDPTTLKTINSQAIHGTGNFSLEPTIAAGNDGEYWMSRGVSGSEVKTWEAPDLVPTALSDKLITSGAVYAEIADIKTNGLDFATSITAGDTRAPETDAVYTDVLAPLNTHITNTGIHVTTQNKSDWDAKQDAIMISGILKGDGAGNISQAAGGSAATAGHDYQTPMAEPGAVSTSDMYKFTTNSYGQVISTTAVVKADIVGLGIPAQDTTYNRAVPSSDGVLTDGVDGLMSMFDKYKLDNIQNDSQENVIEVIEIDGIPQAIVNKVVDLPPYPTVNDPTITINAGNTSSVPSTDYVDTFTLNRNSALTINFHEISKSGDYADLLNKPSTFAPSAHTHVVADVTNFPTGLDYFSNTVTNFQNATDVNTSITNAIAALSPYVKDIFYVDSAYITANPGTPYVLGDLVALDDSGAVILQQNIQFNVDVSIRTGLELDPGGTDPTINPTSTYLVVNFGQPDQSYADLTAIIPVFSGVYGTTIDVNVSGQNIGAEVKSGSIAKTHLTSGLQAELDGKIAKKYAAGAPTVVPGNIAEFDSNGDIVDSGSTVADFFLAADFNGGALSSSSTTTAPNEKAVYDAIAAVNTSIGNGRLRIIIEDALGTNISTTDFTANQSGNASDITIEVPAAYVIGSDHGGNVETDWTT